MSYSVENLHGCTMIMGLVPISDMFKLMTPPPGEEWVIEPNLALKLGASLICGSKENLKLMAASADIQSRIRARQAELLDGVPVSEAAFTWLVVGERGKSSDSVFGFLAGVKSMQHRAHPHDIADFRRCRLLLEQVPEFNDQRQALTGLSDVWDGLASKWDDLCALMDDEAPEWRERLVSAPQTYRALQQISTSRGQ